VTAVSILLGLLPLLLLVAALVAGRYPGEQLIERMRPLRRRPVAAAPRPLAARFVRSRSRRLGELLSRSLAGRAPPRAPA
jgi:hypothetical protein